MIELKWYGTRLFKARHWSVPKENNPPVARLLRVPGCDLWVIEGLQMEPMTFENARKRAEERVRASR